MCDLLFVRNVGKVGRGGFNRWFVLILGMRLGYWSNGRCKFVSRFFVFFIKVVCRFLMYVVICDVMSVEEEGWRGRFMWYVGDRGIDGGEVIVGGLR